MLAKLAPLVVSLCHETLSGARQHPRQQDAAENDQSLQANAAYALASLMLISYAYSLSQLLQTYIRLLYQSFVPAKYVYIHTESHHVKHSYHSMKQNVSSHIPKHWMFHL